MSALELYLPLAQFAAFSGGWIVGIVGMLLVARVS